MEELLRQLSLDLQNLAMPRTYDWLILLVSAISIVLTFIIFRRQTKISKKQTDIMEQQNKIALFEKRYEAFAQFKKLYLYGTKTLAGQYVDGISYEIKYREFDAVSFYYLFNEAIGKESCKILYSLFLLNDAHEAQRSGKSTLLSMGETKENMENHKKIVNFENFTQLCKQIEEYITF